MTLDREDIAAIAAEVARLLAPVLAGKVPVEDPQTRLEKYREECGDPESFAARRQAALDIAAKKGILRRQ